MWTPLNRYQIEVLLFLRNFDNINFTEFSNDMLPSQPYEVGEGSEVTL